MPRTRLPARSLRAVQLRSVQLRSVRLEAPPLPAGAERPNPDWIQIAAEGDYKGYGGGSHPFVLDEPTFAVIVRNFRAHPAYVAAGGPTDIVAFDFSHASEGDPASIAVDGSPAQAWVQELEIRQGAKGAELWALTRFLEPMLTYRAEGRYKWTSVCVWPDSIDPVSGQPIGWVLSSVAFTNDPFIQGMVPIAASRHFDPYDPPATPLEVLEAMRGLFALDALASVDDVLASLAKLRAYASGSTPAPAGVNVDELVGELRLIFNLPTLAPTASVLAETDALLVALAEAPAVSTIAATREDSHDMDPFKTAVIALAARLGRKLPEKEDQIPAFLCEAVDGAVAEAESPLKKAEADLGAMLMAVGEQDVPGGVKRIADLIQQAARLKAVLPSLKAFEDSQAEQDEQSVEEDVAMAMTTHFGGAQAARAALVYMRTPKKDANGVTTPEDRKLARETFLAQYPRPTSETKKLTTATTTNGAITASTGGSPQGRVPALPDGKIPTTAEVEAMVGGNPNARALSLVRARGGDKLSHEQACALAFDIVKGLAGSASNGAPASL